MARCTPWARARWQLFAMASHASTAVFRSSSNVALVRHFVQHFARRMNRVIDTIPSETMEALIRHSWPGNIRELQNLVEHSVILSSGPALRVPLTGLQSSAPASQVGTKRRTMEEAEREHILATLKETKWVSSPVRVAQRRGWG